MAGTPTTPWRGGPANALVEAALGLPPGTVQPNIHDYLGIEIVELGPDRVVLQVPITWQVHQPFGLLHGGVSALLAESAASLGGGLAAGPGHRVVGIELNCSHLRGVSQGLLTATATPIRTGRTIQVWDIALTDDQDRAICQARCTLAVTASPAAAGAPGTP